MRREDGAGDVEREDAVAGYRGLYVGDWRLAIVESRCSGHVTRSSGISGLLSAQSVKVAWE